MKNLVGSKTAMRIASLAAVAVTFGSVGYLAAHVGRAPATPTPVVAPLYYSGFLTQSGVPVSGPHTVLVTASSGSGSGQSCTSVGSTVQVVAGHFSVQMQDACHAVFTNAQGSTAVTATVTVEGTAVGSAVAVGATPYAYAADQVSGPSIIGQTTEQFDGAGTVLNAPIQGSGYTGLTKICQSDFGSGAFVCTLNDAVRSISRGVPGAGDMGDNVYVAGGGGGSDCGGFTNDNDASAVAGSIDYVTINSPVPSTAPCDLDGTGLTGLHVLCCGYP